ncbi:MAG: hypothetical protein JJU33_06350 [Phycisphaerales bacterium]|nr:hypothetical protein [Phycisphaerales bacterium]
MHTHRTKTARAIGCVLALVLCAVASGQGLLDRLVPAEPTPNAPSLAISTPLLSIASGGQPFSVSPGVPVPIEVVIGPGDFSGVVLVTSLHDATQSGRVFAIASADPDSPTRVPLVFEVNVSPYAQSSDVRVELHGLDSAGDPVFRREEFELASMTSRRRPTAQQSMPFRVETGTDLVGVIGQVGVPGRARAVRDFRFVAIEPDGAPELWRAYQGMAAIVAEERALVEYSDGAIEAMAAWLHAGGRLVLIAEPGASGRTRLASALGQDPAWWRDIERAPPDPQHRDATPIGDGFLLLHSDSGSLWARSSPGVQRAGTAVVGFGSVLVVDGDPDLASISNTSAVLHALEFDDSMARQTIAWSGYQTNRNVVSMALLDETVLDGEIDPGRAAWNLMIGVCVLVLLLALMLGPVDRFVLKRKGLGSLSWATALFWLLAASLLAVVGPRVIRSSDDTLTRVDALDLIAGADGSSGWGLGTTGVFAGRAISYTPEAAQGSWWRGVSVSRADTEVFSPITLAQGRGVSPGGMTPMGGSDGHAFEQPQWTFRMFEDRAPAHYPLTGRVEIEASVRQTVVIEGMPEGAVIRGATVHSDPSGRVAVAPFSGEGATRRARVDPNLSPDRRLRDRVVSASELNDTAGRTPAIGWMLQSGAYAMVTLDVEGWPTRPPSGFSGAVKSVAVVRLVVPVVHHDESAGKAGDGEETP